MHDFSEELWKERALTRFKRACLQSTSKQSRALADKQWQTDINCIDAMNVVVNWCTSKKIDVQFGKKSGAIYDPNTRSITMTVHSGPEKQLFMLLHECGHHLIGFTKDDERFGKGYPFIGDSDVNTTFHHRLACLEEEIEAWHRGWKLSKRLKLELDRDRFDKVRVECLKGYIKWANSRRSMT